MRAHSFSIALAAVMLAVLVSLTADAQNTSEVEVEADRLSVDHSQRTARFEGNVRVRRSALALTCDLMLVSYDDDGAVVALKATGRVTVRRGDAWATANSGRLDARQQLLVLEGSPVLVSGSHRLEGKRIAVHLESGRLEVLRAKGTFRLDLGGAR